MPYHEINEEILQQEQEAAQYAELLRALSSLDVQQPDEWNGIHLHSQNATLDVDEEWQMTILWQPVPDQTQQQQQN